MSIAYDVRHILDVQRCYRCKRYYASEAGEPGRCPSCAEERDRARTVEINRLRSELSHVRGALTRAKLLAKPESEEGKK